MCFPFNLEIPIFQQESLSKSLFVGLEGLGLLLVNGKESFPRLRILIDWTLSLPQTIRPFLHRVSDPNMKVSYHYHAHNHLYHLGSFLCFRIPFLDYHYTQTCHYLVYYYVCTYQHTPTCFWPKRRLPFTHRVSLGFEFRFRYRFVHYFAHRSWKHHPWPIWSFAVRVDRTRTFSCAFGCFNMPSILSHNLPANFPLQYSFIHLCHRHVIR